MIEILKKYLEENYPNGVEIYIDYDENVDEELIIEAYENSKDYKDFICYLYEEISPKYINFYDPEGYVWDEFKEEIYEYAVQNGYSEDFEEFEEQYSDLMSEYCWFDLSNENIENLLHNNNRYVNWESLLNGEIHEQTLHELAWRCFHYEELYLKISALYFMRLKINSSYDIVLLKSAFQFNGKYPFNLIEKDWDNIFCVITQIIHEKCNSCGLDLNSLEKEWFEKLPIIPDIKYLEEILMYFNEEEWIWWLNIIIPLSQKEKIIKHIEIMFNYQNDLNIIYKVSYKNSEFLDEIYEEACKLFVA